MMNRTLAHILFFNIPAKLCLIGVCALYLILAQIGEDYWNPPVKGAEKIFKVECDRVEHVEGRYYSCIRIDPEIKK